MTINLAFDCASDFDPHFFSKLYFLTSVLIAFHRILLTNIMFSSSTCALCKARFRRSMGPLGPHSG
jgi:hypothetical protein